ncbi:hypothetical protein AB0M48_27295 [Lentzea sp. NPDC051208]|uniref:hypothetical protein n=1 Tax=Lentzea sp. NPDC051208 TaxID=3154642 RepID=UPI00343F45C5
MKRPVIAAAVLCLLAAQPASAAWQTSKTGTAQAKAGTVEPLVITSCAKAGNSTTVKWEAVPGAGLYTVMWQQGGGGSFNKEFSTTALTYNVPLAIDRVRVQAAVGSWSTSHTQINCP